MRYTLLVAIGFLLILPTPSAQATDGGIYLGAHGALNIVQGARNDSPAGSFNFEFDPGYTGAVTLGYDLRDRFPLIGIGRMEVEAAYRSNRLDEMEFAEGAGGQGRVKVSSLMFNTFGEHRGTVPWIPYIGAGIGVARVELDRFRFGSGLVVDGSDTVFAWQVGGGFGYLLSRRVTLDMGYRFFSAMDPKFRDTQGVRFESEYDAHTILLGLRVDF
jgi:opacity protein-like surface antigen